MVQRGTRVGFSLVQRAVHMMLGATLMYAVLMVLGMGRVDQQGRPRQLTGSRGTPVTVAELSTTKASAAVSPQWSLDSLRSKTWQFATPQRGPCVRRWPALPPQHRPAGQSRPLAAPHRRRRRPPSCRSTTSRLACSPRGGSLRRASDHKRTRGCGRQTTCAFTLTPSPENTLTREYAQPHRAALGLGITRDPDCDFSRQHHPRLAAGAPRGLLLRG